MVVLHCSVFVSLACLRHTSSNLCDISANSYSIAVRIVPLFPLERERERERERVCEWLLEFPELGLLPLM